MDKTKVEKRLADLIVLHPLVPEDEDRILPLVPEREDGLRDGFVVG